MDNIIAFTFGVLIGVNGGFILAGLMAAGRSGDGDYR